jgi:hypothetical protein
MEVGELDNIEPSPRGEDMIEYCVVLKIIG